MRIVTVQGEALLYDQEFSRGTIYVGRHEQCQIRLPGDEIITPRHLMIFEEDGKWYVDPLCDQYHLTKLNDRLLQGKQELTDGCELRVAEYCLTCYLTDQKQTQTIPLEPETKPAGAVRNDRGQPEQGDVLDQELAKKVRAQTAPSQVPQWPELHLSVLAETGRDVCTDFHDILPLGERQAMAMVGCVPPGLPDTAVCIAQMVSAFRIGGAHRDFPQVLLRQINWLMFTTASEPRQISAGVLSVDPQTGELLYCSAGDVHAFAVAATGKVVKAKMAANPLVGESRKSKYESVKGRLEANQSFVVCTNGIFSLISNKGEPFDEPHLSDLLSAMSQLPPAKMMRHLADDISAFTGGTKPLGDITLLMVRKLDKAS